MHCVFDDCPICHPEILESFAMHYKNGREAKPGDKVLNLTTGRTGIVHSINAGSKTCNARLAPFSDSDAYATLGECLRVDDIAMATIPNPVETDK